MATELGFAENALVLDRLEDVSIGEITQGVPGFTRRGASLREDIFVDLICSLFQGWQNLPKL
jgi:hypothetical protein